MKLKVVLALAASFALIATTATAAVRNFFGIGDIRICTLTEPCDADPPTSGGQFFPAGTSEGPYTVLKIDDDNGGPSPTIVEFIAHQKIQRVFLTSTTTGVPGSYSVVKSDTRSTIGAGTVGTRVGNVVTWGPLTVTNIGGLGQYCQDFIASGGCASSGLVPVATWNQSIPPISPVDMGPMTVAPDFSSYTSPTPYKYFDVFPLLGANIFGYSSNRSGAETVAGVPLLAPLGALALASSLAYMGVRNVRRKED